tara:strand:- start:166 stop:546 length:381 start_codon:yes stop_codon:yes gene_type:complete
MEMKQIKVNSERAVKVQVGKEFDSEQDLIGMVELDIETQSKFLTFINQVIEGGMFNIMLDMANISYIDSSGLWALFEGHKKATQNSGHMVLLNPNPDVRRVLDITKISTKMSISDDEEAAIQLMIT